jgi:hypothetical protein
MATQKLNLTRDQLATFLKNHEQIKQFERLFQVVDEVSPSSDTTGISIQAGNADAAANEALAQIAALAQDTAINDAVLNAKIEQALDAIPGLSQVLNMLALAPIEQHNNSVATDYIDFSTTAPAPAIRVGRLHWNGGYTLNLEMTPNVNQSIGESQYYYIKASAAITKGQLVMFDGAVGSSGVLQGKPSNGVTNGQYIMGVASEDIANNAFGLVSSFGLVRGFDTTGTPYGEVWADGDILYYNPSYAGGLTKNIPAAPTPHVVVAAVVNAGPAGSGSVFVRVQAEPLVSQLSDVFLSGVANGDLLQYDSVQQRWENVPASTLPVGTATNLAGGAAGSVPYQSAPSTTAMLPIGASGRWLGSSGTLPQWNAPAALTKTDDTNVTLTLGGSASTALLNAASLTLGWTGTLAASRGGTGFGSYAVGDILYADTTTTFAKLPDVATGNALISGGVGVAPSWGKIGLTTHITGTLPVANGGTGTVTAFTAGSVVFAGASGVYAQDNTNFFWDDTNNRLGIGTATPSVQLHLAGSSTTALARIANTGNGAGAFDGSGAGLELLATGMNGGANKYAPAIKFGSTDPDFTTTNPKFGAAIVATAAQTYSSDTTGGMNLEFWTAPVNPGTGSGLVLNMTLTSAGRLGVGNAAPACSLDVTGGIQTSQTTVTSPAATDGNIFSGSYTPTLTNTTNITSSTASTLYYTRVGNVVAVFGRVNITATATGNTLLGISLPIASALTTNGQVAGMGSVTSATVANNTFGRINADATNDRAQFQLNSTTTTDQTYAINFTYVVL